MAPSSLFLLLMSYTNHLGFLPSVSEMTPLGHSPHLFHYQASPMYLLYSSTLLGLGRFGVKEGYSLCPENWAVTVPVNLHNITSCQIVTEQALHVYG